MLFKLGNQMLEKEAYDRAIKARAAKEEVSTESTTPIKVLQDRYKEQEGKDVPNNMKNNAEWITSKLK